MPAPHVRALAAILAVTRRQWLAGQDEQGGQAAPRTGSGPRQPPHDSYAGAPGSRPLRRREQLARRAARAFEAQVMALRCRQAFVA
ncbi:MULTISPECIES: hypothetical protein [Cupriavidus]